MIEEVLIDELVISPPQVWARKLRQAAIIYPLAKRAIVSSGELNQACAELGIGRRRVNQLLNIARARFAGAPPRGHLTGIHSQLDDCSEQLLVDAISLAGPAARQRDVSALVLQLSQERGCEPPCDATVRNRFNLQSDRINLVDRFGLSCDIVADLCPLALPVLAKSDEPMTAWLLALVETRTARIVHNDLFAGRPQASEARHLIAQIGSRIEGAPRIGVTGSLFKLFGKQTGCDGIGLRAASSSRSLPAGAVIRAVCGRSVGRVPLRAEGSVELRYDISPVQLAVSKLIISRVLGRLDARAYSGVGVQHGPRLSICDDHRFDQFP